MYLIRDTFHLKYGMFKEALVALQQANKHGLFPAQGFSILSDFTGDAYRLVIEISYPSLAEYEQQMAQGMKDPYWQEFYTQFKNYIQNSHREIMKKHIL